MILRISDASNIVRLAGESRINENKKRTRIGGKCPVKKATEERSERSFIQLDYKFLECRNDTGFRLHHCKKISTLCMVEVNSGMTTYHLINLTNI